MNSKKIIMIGGLPGTGKTYLAKALASKLGAVHLSSDGIRKELGQLGKYKETDKDAIYTAMKKELVRSTKQNDVIIVDTTFSKRQLRNEIIEIAHNHNFEWYFILTTASEKVAMERTSIRRLDSEADYSVYKLIQSEFEPVAIEYLKLSTDSESIENLLQMVFNYCELTND